MSAILAETRPDEAHVVVEAPHPERKRVVIVGGGFAGLSETETVLDASDNIHASAEGRERIFFLTSPL